MVLQIIRLYFDLYGYELPELTCFIAVFKSLMQQRGILGFAEWVKGNQIFVQVYC